MSNWEKKTLHEKGAANNAMERIAASNGCAAEIDGVRCGRNPIIYRWYTDGFCAKHGDHARAAVKKNPASIEKHLTPERRG